MVFFKPHFLTTLGPNFIEGCSGVNENYQPFRRKPMLTLNFFVYIFSNNTTFFYQFRFIIILKIHFFSRKKFRYLLTFFQVQVDRIPAMCLMLISINIHQTIMQISQYKMSVVRKWVKIARAMYLQTILRCNKFSFQSSKWPLGLPMSILATRRLMPKCNIRCSKIIRGEIIQAYNLPILCHRIIIELSRQFQI